MHCLALEDVDGATSKIKGELKDITGKASGPISLDQLQGVLVNLGVVLGHDEMRDLRAALLRPSSSSSAEVVPIAPITDADADVGDTDNKDKSYLKRPRRKPFTVHFLSNNCCVRVSFVIFR